MSTSILNDVKKFLGPGEDYNWFDPDIVMNINSAFATLEQVGMSSISSFIVNDQAETWDDYFNSVVHDEDLWLNDMNREMVKQYVYTYVRIAFDPPTSSFVLTSFENRLKELEWRISVLACKRSNV